jgi:glycosyltransferase involved in cell wall biosynthesis
VDVRDLWPDVFVDKSPRLLRPAVRPLLARDYSRTRRIFEGAAAIVATSSGYLKWALRWAGRPGDHMLDRVLYLGAPPLVDVNATPSSRVQALTPALAGRTVFTFVGSFGHSYELSLICEVARLLRERSDLHFVIAGTGAQADLVTLAARELPNVTYVGWLSAAETRQLLACSHVGLVPCLSLKDTMPNKVFEYLAAGRPIVATDLPTHRTVLSEDRAILVRPDAQSLAGGIVRVLRDPALARRLGSAGRAYAEQHLGWPRFVHSVREIYDEVHLGVRVPSR